MKLETEADWQISLGYRLEECRQMCAGIGDETIKMDMLDEYSDLCEDTTRQLRMLCNRAHKLTRRARQVKES